MRKALVEIPALIALSLSLGLTAPALSEQRAADGCTTAVASAPRSAARTAFVSLSASPFGIAVTPDSRWSFVAEAGGHLAVLASNGFRPRLLRTIAVPPDALGDALTPDGRYVLVANGVNGATVVDVHRAESGGPHAVLGTLAQPSDKGPGGAIYVALSPDGHYAFVSVEFEARVAVYNLSAALKSHFGSTSYVGSIGTGLLADGLGVSADGRWLYAISEVAAAGASTGSLSVISLATAEHRPARSVVATVAAGCTPVRVAPSADGRTVWVTARGSDQLLAFSAKKLHADPSHSLLAAVRVGEAPIGLAIVNRGREIVVANSNRFAAPGAKANLTIVRTAAALAHRRPLLSTVPTGAFPREMALEPGRSTLLVGNFDSNQLEAVDLRHLPQRRDIGDRPLARRALHGDVRIGGRW